MFIAQIHNVPVVVALADSYKYNGGSESEQQYVYFR